jgi:hypothetical protein
MLRKRSTDRTGLRNPIHEVLVVDDGTRRNPPATLDVRALLGP